MPPPSSSSLSDWLLHIEQVHPRAIDMGLDRVRSVQHALGLKPGFPIITVGGTNGKGSACAMLASILHEAGYRVGCYTSPHLLRYNERIRLSRDEARDEQIVEALRAVETARGGTPLTYFEFTTLAAVWLFVRERADCAILEVGLGGRLDAVNAFDADCSMIMSIALDHMDYLGDTREAIGFEKAGIMRAGRPAICADVDPPVTLTGTAAELGAQLLLQGRDFGYEAQPQQWRYWGPGGDRHGLPYPALRGRYQLGNAAACLAALDVMRDALPVGANDIRSGLLKAENPGRFQVLPGRPLVILDVAHNPHAAAVLARTLRELPGKGRVLAVFAMLKDKDAAGVVDMVKQGVDEWLVADIDAPRGSRAGALHEVLRARGVTAPVSEYSSVAEAYARACDQADDDDKILVFGSFYTVAGVMAARARRSDR
ncbi:MAG: bifunctional tetrahydrofolate synthase/dihydrofolate synthase [Rhodospirillaceae bacterium]